MSCRSTPASSAATTFARLNCSLNDVQTLSAFHALRADAPRDAPAPDREQWQQWCETERGYIEHHPNLTDARRRSLLARMDAAVKAPLPDGRTWVALRRIRSTTQSQSRELDTRYAQLAADLDTDVPTVRRMAEELMGQVDTRRDATPPPGYSPVAVRAAREHRLPVDRASVHALATLERRASAARQEHNQEQGRRVTRVPLQSSAIAEAGYDPDGGRLEVVFANNPERVYAYHDVPAAVWQQMQSSSAGRAWHAHIRNNAAVRYASQDEADADAYYSRVRCAGCGRFTPRSGAHTCTAGTGSASTSVPRRFSSLAAREQRIDDVNGVQVSLPDVNALRAAAAQGPVQVEIAHTGHPGEDHDSQYDIYMLTGSVEVHTEAEGLAVRADGLRCTCRDYRLNGTCPHIRAHEQAIMRRIDPQRATVQDIARLQAEVDAAQRADWMRSRKYSAEARARWQPDGEVMYGEDPASFDTVVAQAQRLWAEQGENPVPYATQDATGGLLSRESGRGFGVEIEFEFPSDMPYPQRAAALEAIGRDLHARGLTRSAAQRGYHSAEETGYSDSHAGGWSFEEDGSVDGEIVSPIMYDEPETWANLAAVCDIVAAHGGVASTKSGSHVHIGAVGMEANPAAHTELARLVNQHEDVLYRLAQNPRSSTGEHRPLGYCRPNPEVPLAGYRNVTQSITANEGHHVGLNLHASDAEGGGHIEFRQWDGSLDAAVIQTQVKLSAALVAAAVRETSVPGRISAPRPREPIGAHHARTRLLLDGSRRALSAEERAQDTATTRSMLDTLFTRRQDKEQAAALFAVTRWQRRNPSRGRR